MNVGATADSLVQSLTNLDPVENRRAALQVALLKKTLQSQEEQAADLMRLMEGKGRVVDIRV